MDYSAFAIYDMSKCISDDNGNITSITITTPHTNFKEYEQYYNLDIDEIVKTEVPLDMTLHKINNDLENNFSQTLLSKFKKIGFLSTKLYKITFTLK